MDSAQPLYDLAPIARVALMGIALAAGPLAWVWLRNREAGDVGRLQALTLLTLFLTFDLVLFGAFTRLTDSGLGCPDWPGCYGNASPLGASADIHAAQTAMPGGPVTHGKAWVEMIHRYLATGVGVLITVLAIASWLDARRRRREGGEGVSPWWATATLVWVAVQGAFGALTVTMKLYPAIVTLHLLGGLGLLALLAAQLEAYRRAPLPLPGALYRTALAVFVLCVVQIALGGWVSTNYAVLACTDFPTCQGAWWPAMDFDHGFTIWRALGRRQGRRLAAVRRADRHPLHASPGGLCRARGARGARLEPLARRQRTARAAALGARDRRRRGVATGERPVATSCSAGRWSLPWRTPAARR